jgi:adenylate cyclase
VFIITMLLLLSLGTITGLVSYFVSADVRITAEENNFNANKRSASEAEAVLSSVRSAAFVLLDTVAAGGENGTFAEEISKLFFDHNKDIAAIIAPGARRFINTDYFLTNELDPVLTQDFLDKNRDSLERCFSGETLVLNAAPVFHLPVLVLLLPHESRAAAVFFSAESLGDSFGQGMDSSFLVNGAGDVLIHPDYELVRAGANFADRPFVETLRSSAETNLQTLYTDSDGTRYFGAFLKLSVGGAAVVTNVEYDKVFEGVLMTMRRNLFLSGAVLFASVILIWLFSKTISRPLKVLTDAAREIEAGHFELDIKPKTRDEVGALTSSFGKMSGALEIFGRFTNREIAVRAMRGEIKPGGEAKSATIFFSDIRNFTAISESFTKEFGDGASDKIVYWLNEYFTQMVACVEKTGGVVDKFIGDAVMAHWGTAYTAGTPQKDAFNCVRTALMMRNALIKLNASRQANDPANPFIRIGCGINTGVVTVGQLGSAERMEYTAIGDAVNLASRTEALNKPLGTDILITEDTWKLVGKHLIVEEMPPVRVKGKEMPVRMFAVVNMKVKEGAQPPPRSLAEVRKLLGITPPDISKVDVNAEEQKYKLGSK